jgi:lactoylglutathione lyase
MAKQADYVIVFVSDMSTSVRFYRDVLGLQLRFETPDWTEFETGTTTIALHGKSARRTEPAALDPQAGECRLGFNVENVEKLVAALEASGTRIARRPMPSEGDQIILAIVLDPDGMPISLAQTLQKA